MFRSTSISAVGAKGLQIWVPEEVKGNSTSVTDFGLTIIVPLTRDIKGKLLISLIDITKLFSTSSQIMEEGPTVRLDLDCCKAELPRSVIVNRPPGP